MTEYSEIQSFGRPDNYWGLLKFPLADDPHQANASYDDWEFDHGQSQRFYVGGMRWFMRSTLLDKISQLAAFGEQASDIAAKIGWADMPNSRDLWRTASMPQFRASRQREPLFFQKAALVILACELALEAQIEAGKDLPSKINSADVYKHMKIIPAVWNIDELDTAIHARDKNPSSSIELPDGNKLDMRSLLRDLSVGHTVTWNTAKLVGESLRKQGFEIGRIRARPGRKLGTRSASLAERVQTG